MTGNLVSVIEARAAAHGWLDRRLLVADGAVHTHGEVLDLAARTATVLDSHGVREGDRVLIAAADSLAFAVAFLGGIRLGAVPVTVNRGLTAAEHAAFVEDARPALAVVDGEIEAHVADAPRVVPASSLVDQSRAAAPTPVHEVHENAPAYVQYTSGTTGRPKGAVHRHADPLVYFDAVARGVYDMRPDDVVLCVSKMFFAYGLPSSLLHPLLSGASAVLWRARPTPAVVTELCRQHAVTILLTVPTFYAGLVDAGERDAFRTLRIAVSGGEPLLARLRADAEALLGCPVLNHLGSTEVGHGYVGDLVDDHRPGTTGRAIAPYRVEVRDDDGAALPPGQEGVVWVKGPTLMTEYLGKPEETAAVLVDGWLRSGDLGVLDADSYLTLAGGADDIEMVSGHKVWPGEIEGVIGEHPAVQSVAVVGDVGERGSVLRALVIPRPGHSGDQALVDELVLRARERLAPFKVPRLFTFVDDLPRTATGKLQRFRLRRELATFASDERTIRRREDWMTGRTNSDKENSTT